jgi:hypothetical protein
MSTPTVPTTTHHVNGSIHTVELTWDQVFDGIPMESPAKKAWREAIMDVAERAKAKLPECTSRIANAVKLVLTGDVALLDDGTAQVRGQANGKPVYHLANGSCTCPDYHKAFEGWCKHRIAAAIYRRARAQVAQQLQELDAPVQPITTPQDAPEAPIAPAVTPVIPTREVTHTEAPASANTYLTLHGYRVQLTLRGVDEHEVLARLAAVLAQFPLDNDEAEPTAPPPVPEGWCRLHDVQMPQHTKDGRSWYSHLIAPNTWCRGK